MAFVVGSPCVGCKDTACVTVCPVDCCVPDEDNVETEDFLKGKQKFMHPEN